MQRSSGQGWALACLVALAGCNGDRAADDVRAIGSPAIARVMPADQALAGAHVATLDPAPLEAAEIENIVGTGAYCAFRYTSAGEPVLGVGASPSEPSVAVVKLNGHLVVLGPAPTPGDSRNGVSFVAEPVHVSVEPDEPGPSDTTWRSDATMVFEVSRQLRVGYRGFYSCAAGADDEHSL